MRFIRFFKSLIFEKKAPKISELLIEKRGAMESLISEIEKEKMLSRIDNLSKENGEEKDLEAEIVRPSAAKF